MQEHISSKERATVEVEFIDPDPGVFDKIANLWRRYFPKQCLSCSNGKVAGRTEILVDGIEATAPGYLCRDCQRRWFFANSVYCVICGKAITNGSLTLVVTEPAKFEVPDMYIPFYDKTGAEVFITHLNDVCDGRAMRDNYRGVVLGKYAHGRIETVNRDNDTVYTKTQPQKDRVLVG